MHNIAWFGRQYSRGRLLDSRGLRAAILYGMSFKAGMSNQGVTMIIAMIGLLFAAIFVVDVLTPQGLPFFVLYVLPLALTSLLRRRQIPYWLAAAASSASIIGYFLGSPLAGVPAWLPIINHVIGIGLFWLSAVVIQRQQDMADHLIQMASLEAENKAHLIKEQSLRRQAEQIHDLYNRAPCGYHSLDITGLFTEVNDTELQWLGYAREEIVGQMRFADLLTAPSAERFQNTFAHFISQGSILDLELDLRRRDGFLLPVSLSATAIRDGQGRYLSGRSTIVDITNRRRTEEALHHAHEALETQVRDRTAELAVANRRLEEQLQESRKAELALRASEGRFRLMADHAPVLIWISDTTKACTWFNKPWLDFVGRRMDQEIGNGWSENVHPDDLARCLTIYVDSFDARREFTMEYRLRRQDGAWRWILDHGIPRHELDGSFAGYIGSCTDIDDRKQAEELHARLAAIVESSTDAIASATLDGMVQTWNDGAQRIFGYSAEEMIGRSIFILIPPDRYAEEHDIVRQVQDGQRINQYETARIKKDGTTLEVSVTVSPMKDPHGRVVGIAVILRDITERKHVEQTLMRKNKDLETLLHVTSHDLKEPLRAIESFSQLVEQRYADRLDARGADYLRRIVRATQRLDRLLSDILDLSRAQRMVPPMEDVEAGVLVKEALRRLDVRIKETRAQVKLIEPLPVLRVNRTWATQGLYNLLANALKFTRDGQPPDVEVAAYERHCAGHSTAGLVVRDRGPGVPARHADKIFQLFQRAVGRDVEGTGAGLAIVRQVAERHGGHAWVEARPDGGSAFIITFECPTLNGNRGSACP